MLFVFFFFFKDMFKAWFCPEMCCTCGFSLHAKIMGKGSTNNSPPAIICFSFTSGAQLVRTSFTLLGQESLHSGSATRDDCGRAFPNEEILAATGKGVGSESVAKTVLTQWCMFFIKPEAVLPPQCVFFIKPEAGLPPQWVFLIKPKAVLPPQCVFLITPEAGLSPQCMFFIKPEAGLSPQCVLLITPEAGLSPQCVFS